MRDTHMDHGSVEEISIGLKCGGEAFVVIDSLVNGTSSGGVRISADIAIDEVRALAREMTLKFGFFRLPRGGAKCGIRIPGEISQENRMELLEDFGKKISHLIGKGIYYPGMDMNCGPKELKAIYRGAECPIGDITDTSWFTALSAANAVMAAREFLDLGNRPLTLAIEGLGSVGDYLCQRLNPEEFRIVAVSTVAGAIAMETGFAASRITKMRKAHGDDFISRLPEGKKIPREDLLKLNVDILVPSARTWSIRQENADEIRAACIVPVANAPYAGSAPERLHQKGIWCLPGYVVNSGGVFASSLSDSGVPAREIETLAATFFRRIVYKLLVKSAEMGISPVESAGRIARGSSETKRRWKRGLMKKAFRKGLLSEDRYGRFYLREFTHDLKEIENRVARYA